MKKVLCLIMCLLTVIQFGSIAISATTQSSNSSVMKELETLYIDGKQFSEADYPVNTSDKNMYILTVVEKGFVNTNVSNGFALYLYVYNPSGTYFIDREDNSIQIGVNVDCKEYSFYRIKRVSISDDCRFIKFQVLSHDGVELADLYKNQKKANERVYNIACLRLYVDGKLTRYTTKESFFFSGFDFDNTLTCNGCELGALDVELKSTNWISPNAGTKVDGSSATIYDHYEINSVYFSVPESYFQNYTYISSIRAVYDALRLTPIVVTNPDNFSSAEGIATKNAILDGEIITEGGALDVFDLCATMRYSYMFPDWIYTESAWLQNFYADKRILQCLAYYFENEELLTDFDFEGGKYSKVAVSAEELKAYFYERYNNSEYDNTKLYTEKHHKELDYTAGEMYNLKTYTADLSTFAQWWLKVCVKDDSYLFADFNKEVEEIKVIDNPSAYASIDKADYEECANELFIGLNDVGAFSDFCSTAAANNERVVLLRFGYSDYSCTPIYDVWEATGSPGFGEPIAMSVEKWAYMNISLAHIVFRTDGEDIVVPVVSNVVDSFGDIVIFEDPVIGSGISDNDDEKGILQLLMIVVIVVLVIVVICAFRKKKRKNKQKNE